MYAWCILMLDIRMSKIMKLYSPRIAAFTLIELLVTIGILLALAALIIPAATGARNKANITRCSEHMRQITASVHAYAADNNNESPTLKWKTGKQDADYWFRQLQPYVDPTKSKTDPLLRMFRCPADTAKWNDRSNQTGFGGVSYIMLTFQDLVDTDNDNSKDTAVPRRLAAESTNMGSKPLLIDAVTVGTEYVDAGFFNEWVGGSKTNPKWRHGKGVNVAYLDGHVEFIANPTYDKMVKKAQ